MTEWLALVPVPGGRAKRKGQLTPCSSRYAGAGHDDNLLSLAGFDVFSQTLGAALPNRSRRGIIVDDRVLLAHCGGVLVALPPVGVEGYED